MTVGFPEIRPDRHGNLPRLHYDAPGARSPTTRADLLAWCAASRSSEAVLASMRCVCAVILSAVMAGRIDADRFARLGEDVTAALEAAADDIHELVREFGYDPTDDPNLAGTCHCVVMDRLRDVVVDFSPALNATGGSAALRSAMLTMAFGISISEAARSGGDMDRLLATALSVQDDADETLRPTVASIIETIERLQRRS